MMQKYPKKSLKINYCDGPENFALPMILNLLSDDYELIFTDKPDFLFCFSFGSEFLRYGNCVKIFFYTENMVPDFNYYDYAIGMHDLSFGTRHLYIPYYEHFLNLPQQNRTNLDDALAKRKFCNFIYRNGNSGKGTMIRQEFCKKLMEYKRVDCPGRVLNNMHSINDWDDADWWDVKIEFLKNYKFTIAFENTLQIGYTTEKLYQPFMADSVPIYWGNPDVTRDFNPKSFINCNDYDNDFDKVISRIKELDGDDDQYLRMLKENPLNEPHYDNSQDKIKKFLSDIFERGNKTFYRDERGISVSSRCMRLGREHHRCLFKYYGYNLLSIICPLKKIRLKADKYKRRLEVVRAFL
jgi:hypothetical protein